MSIIKLKVRLKPPYHMGLWTSYVDIYLFGKLIYSKWTNSHPELTYRKPCDLYEITDEEIEKACESIETKYVDKWVSFELMFKEGAFWYREQLKNK